MVVIRQEREHSRQVVASRADLEHSGIKFRQGPAAECLRKRHTATEVFAESFNLTSQWGGAHSGRELLEGALEWNAIAKHRRELLVEEGKLVVIHSIQISLRQPSLKD